jgi:hypothetical protein
VKVLVNMMMFIDSDRDSSSWFLHSRCGYSFVAPVFANMPGKELDVVRIPSLP